MSDPLADARALRGLIEAQADASDGALGLTPPLVEAFARTRLFHLMVPRELGGLDADSDTILDVFEELARADGSVGWTLMANASATSYVAFLDPAVGAEMVKGRPESAIAGQFSPNGRLHRAGAGYRVSGRFQFGSGIGHASYAGGGGFVLRDDGTPDVLPGGVPAYLLFFVPRERIELRGGWDVMGLRGTGSFDYEIPDQPLDPAWTLPIFAPEVKSGSQGLRNPSLIQRCFRDMFTGGLHLYVDRRSYEELAKRHFSV